MNRRFIVSALLIASFLGTLKSLEFSHAQVVPAVATAGIFSGRITGLTNRGSDVGAANGLSTAVGFAPAVETLSPNRACTAMNFAVRVDTAPGYSRSRAFSLTINGLQSSLITCVIAGPSSLTCNSGSATELVPASSTLSIVEVTGGPGLAVGGTAAAFGWECVNAGTAAPAPAATPSTGDFAAEVAACKSTLQSGKVSHGDKNSWTVAEIDRLCNGTHNARDTISCLQSHVDEMGAAAAIDKCR